MKLQMAGWMNGVQLVDALRCCRPGLQTRLVCSVGEPVGGLGCHPSVFLTAVCRGTSLTSCLRHSSSRTCSQCFVCARSLQRINHSCSGWDNSSCSGRIGLTSDQTCLKLNNLLSNVFLFLSTSLTFSRLKGAGGKKWRPWMEFGFELNTSQRT